MNDAKQTVHGTNTGPAAAGNGATLYKIAGWHKHFETHESRKLVRLDWVAIPTKHDGLGFRTLAAQKNAGDLYAAWILLVQIASKGRKDERGVLARDGHPLLPADLELMTGFPARIFERAFVFFAQAPLQWLLAEPSPGNLPISAGAPGKSAGNLPLIGQNPPAQDRTGQTDILPVAAKPAPAREILFDSLAAAEGSDPKQLTKSAARTIAVALAEIRKVAPAVTSEEIAARAARYRRVMPNGTTLTASALAKHWARCGDISYPPKPEDTPPTGWSATLRRLYPDVRADITWGELPAPIRAKVRAA